GATRRQGGARNRRAVGHRAGDSGAARSPRRAPRRLRPGRPLARRRTCGRGVRRG
ncbi:MAG: hypothetical protein AVDCRST_MAG93-9453, partial [uncultured Chloroflexia bacterium]